MKLVWPVVPTITHVDTPKFFAEYERYKDINFKITVDEWMKKLGGSPKLADDLLLQWRESPYESPLRWSITALVSKYPRDELDKILKRAEDDWTTDIQGILDSFDRIEENFHVGQKPKHIATVKALATIAQLQISTETVALYRGLSGSQAKKIISQPHGNIGLDLATSFTSSKIVASMFAYESMRQSREHGVVLRIEVPRHAIIASPHISYGLSGESEYIIASSGAMTIGPENILVID